MYSGGKTWVQALSQALGNGHFSWYNRVLRVSLEGLEYEVALDQLADMSFGDDILMKGYFTRKRRPRNEMISAHSLTASKNCKFFSTNCTYFLYRGSLAYSMYRAQ
jgi:hypothetical protein